MILTICNKATWKLTYSSNDVDEIDLCAIKVAVFLLMFFKFHCHNYTYKPPATHQREPSPVY